VTSFRFVHAADIHLDSPLVGLQRYDGAPVERLRGATREAFAALVSLCCKESVDFLLIAGDLYDGSWKDFSTGLFFAQQMNRLGAQQIPVFIVRGNHDAQSTVTKHLSLPANVTQFDSDAAHTMQLDALNVAIHGRSYATREITDDISVDYPEPVAGCFNIGLLHTSADGREGHEPYAPCHPGSLVAKGYDYWALGHVHQREVLHKDPWIVFSGNLQGRHARETGAKGCTVIEVVDGVVSEVKAVTLDVVRWSRVTIDLTDVRSSSEMLECVANATAKAISAADGRMVALRLELHGSSTVHGELAREPERWTNEIRQRAMEVAGEDVWIEKIRFKTRPAVSLEELRQRTDPLGDLLRGLDDLRNNPEDIAKLAQVFDDVCKKLPRPAWTGPDGVDLGNVDTLRSLVDDVESLLIPEFLATSDETRGTDSERPQ
jgi:exonuclease SbcD